MRRLVSRKAGERTRTVNLLLTRQLLYQLSYASKSLLHSRLVRPTALVIGIESLISHGTTHLRQLRPRRVPVPQGNKREGVDLQPLFLDSPSTALSSAAIRAAVMGTHLTVPGDRDLRPPRHPWVPWGIRDGD